MEKTDYAPIIAHYFSLEVLRTKELSTGQIHCAFGDGTMSVYSKEQIAQFAEDMMLWDKELEQRRVNAYIDSNLRSNNNVLIPF